MIINKCWELGFSSDRGPLPAGGPWHFADLPPCSYATDKKSTRRFICNAQTSGVFNPAKELEAKMKERNSDDDDDDDEQ
ncbi:unnamed protein product [Danaus chrysippus]|uniref:(African queen) hypothetical protein n=1 Tax=Danaus chrysippus TaxID=151541 RepID=A0A8J2W755_9NEOP|nr:unnamed protein product [Danaus chrysippus]